MRRAVLVCLVLVLAVFLFEAGVHSVHHLDDDEAAPACAIATLCQNLLALGTTVLMLLGAALVAAGTVRADRSAVLALCPLGAVPGRAPPAGGPAPLVLHI